VIIIIQNRPRSPRPIEAKKDHCAVGKESGSLINLFGTQTLFWVKGKKCGFVLRHRCISGATSMDRDVRICPITFIDGIIHRCDATMGSATSYFGMKECESWEKAVEKYEPLLMEMGIGLVRGNKTGSREGHLKNTLCKSVVENC